MEWNARTQTLRTAVSSSNGFPSPPPTRLRTPAKRQGVCVFGAHVFRCAPSGCKRACLCFRTFAFERWSLCNALVRFHCWCRRLLLGERVVFNFCILTVEKEIDSVWLKCHHISSAYHRCAFTLDFGFPNTQTHMRIRACLCMHAPLFVL